MQATLEKAISAVTQEDVSATASGRTDAGAHALQQVVAFSTGSALPATVLGRAINAHLPSDIAVTHAFETTRDFHPRFDASSRIYRYLIWNRPIRSPFWEGRAAHVAQPLDERSMARAASELLGEHDFGAFVPAQQQGSRIRTLFRAECSREGHLVSIELEGTGFMRQMVRSMVGTLIRLGRGRMDQAEFKRILLSTDRAEAADTAPAHGLYLIGVHYPLALFAAENHVVEDAALRQGARLPYSKEKT